MPSRHCVAHNEHCLYHHNPVQPGQPSWQHLSTHTCHPSGISCRQVSTRCFCCHEQSMINPIRGRDQPCNDTQAACMGGWSGFGHPYSVNSSDSSSSTAVLALHSYAVHVLEATLVGQLRQQLFKHERKHLSMLVHSQTACQEAR